MKVILSLKKKKKEDNNSNVTEILPQRTSTLMTQHKLTNNPSQHQWRPTNLPSEL